MNQMQLDLRFDHGHSPSRRDAMNVNSLFVIYVLEGMATFAHESHGRRRRRARTHRHVPLEHAPHFAWKGR